MPMRTMNLPVVLAIVFLGWMASSAMGATDGDAGLIEAVKRGDLSAVQEILGRQETDVNAAEPDGTRALAWAVHRNHVEAAELLIGAGAEVNAANQLGSRPLTLAAANGNAAMVALLLDAGADPDAALLSGETALMTAVDLGSLDVVEALLVFGADANVAESNGGQTALMWAAAEDQPEMVRALVAHGADPNVRSKLGFTPLLFAAQQGAVDAARVLVEAGADLNATDEKRGLTPLALSIASGHSAFPRFFLEQGADPNLADNRGYTPLHYAADERGSPELVVALLEQGADPNARITKDPPRANEGGYALPGATPLFMAARIANLEAVRALIAAGADPLMATDQKTTPFAVAAGVGFPQARDWYEDEQRDFLEIVKILYEHGADLNAPGEHGWTPLHGAAYKGNNEIIRFLIGKDADLEALDEFRQTPLTLAAALQTVEIGDHFYQSPRIARPDSFDLLLSLGATPLAESGVHLVDLPALAR